jgi:hypothetical protein
MKNLLKIGIVLSIVALFSVKLAAQDAISLTLTCQANGSIWFDIFRPTYSGACDVNWGDNTIEKRTGLTLSHYYASAGEYIVTVTAPDTACRFTSFDCKFNYNITTLDLTGCPMLQGVRCDFNQITHLDITGCSILSGLYCNNNQLIRLDLSSCKDLKGIDCWNNQLRLSDLYSISEMITVQSNMFFSTQHLPPQTAVAGEELFSEQSVFSGILTKYAVTKNGEPALESDYTVVDGKLVFNTVGSYTVTMTNDAIVSDEFNPAQVITDITVEKGTGIVETLPATSLQVYPNPTNGQLIINTGGIKIKNIEIFDIVCKSVLKKQLSTFNSQLSTQIDVSYLPAGTYFLRADGQTVEFIKK